MREVRVEFHWDFFTLVAVTCLVITAICFCIGVSQ